jgi:phage portal protein BeeE
MNLPNILSQRWAKHQRGKGQISEAEFFVKSLPYEHQAQGFNLLSELTKMDVVKEPFAYNQKLRQFQSFVSTVYGRETEKTYNPMNPPMSRTSELFGYKPAGAKIWDYFINPFQVYSYVGTHYPAVRMCVDLCRTAIEEDGFYIKGAPGTTEAELRYMYQLCIELRIEELRVEMAAHLQTFGNVWILPENQQTKFPGLAGKLSRLKLLFPSRMLLEMNDREEVVNWIYTEGQHRDTYSKDRLLHIMLPGIDTDQVGSPRLTSAITMIETSFHAQSFNNNLFYKGGLIGHILSLRQPEGQSQFNVQQSREWMREVQEQLNYLASGAKAGGGIVALPWIDNAFPITPIGDLDQNWRYGTERCDKTVAGLLGVPSEKIGIPRSVAAQYQPELVENVINAQFDSTINSLTRRNDRALNREVFRKRLGIDRFKICSSGRYGALTLSAAETIKALASAGPLTTVNEARDLILGWAQLPPNDPRGNIVLDISTLRTYGEKDTVVPALLAPEQMDPELNLDSVDKILKAKVADESCLRIKVGGEYDGEILRPGQKNL